VERRPIFQMFSPICVSKAAARMVEPSVERVTAVRQAWTVSIASMLQIPKA